MKLIKLTKGYEAMVDDEDYERVMQYKWHVWISPHTVYAKYSAYPFGHKRAITVRLHRFIMNAPKGIEVDHIDLNGLNCQKYNLRLATRSLQNLNRDHYGQHEYKGVYPTKLGKWIAKLRCNYKNYYFGTFETIEEAAKAYDKGAIKIWGNNARLNFP